MFTSHSRALRAAATGALALTLAGTTLIGTVSVAQAASSSLDYACGSDGIYGAHGAAVTWDTDAPASVHVGDPAVPVTATGNGLLDNNFTRHLYWNQVARNGSGTSAVSGAVGGTSKTWTLNTSVPMIPSSGTTVISLSGSLGSIDVPSAPGTLPITMGNFSSTMTFANGVNSNISGQFDCLTQGAATVVDTIQVVSRSATTLTVSPVGQGQASRAVAMVTTVGGSPAGRVDFAVDGRVVSADVVNGEAAVDLPVVAPGSYQVTATFVPTDSALYEGSTAQKLLKVTAAEATSTSLALSSATSPHHAPPTATASISTESGAMPAGTVDFTIGGEITTTQVVDGVATATLPDVAPGLHSVKATFTPTQPAQFSASDSTTLPWRVQATTGTTMSLRAGLIGYEQRGRATATVTTSSGSPEGEVTFAVGGTTTTVAVQDGQATADLPQLATGEYQVIATFTPINTTHTMGSTAQPHTLTVSNRPIETPDAVDPALTVGVNIVKPRFGQPVVATARVKDGAAGTVSFTYAGRTSDVPVVDGRASTTLPRVQVGTRRLTVRFTPQDITQFTAASTTRTITVVKARTTVDSLSYKVTKARTVSISAQVKSPQKVTVTGKATIQLKQGAKVIRKATVFLRQGKVTRSWTKVVPGTYTITVRYLGNKNVATSAKSRKAVVR